MLDNWYSPERRESVEGWMPDRRCRILLTSSGGWDRAGTVALHGFDTELQCRRAAMALVGPASPWPNGRRVPRESLRRYPHGPLRRQQPRDLDGAADLV